MKTVVRETLRRVGLYQRIKSSCVYDAYWALVDPAILRQRDCEVEFYRNVLRGIRRGDLVYDVGANEGYKTDIFLRLGARVIAVDPDSHNQAILRQSFLALRFVRRPVEVVGKAVSDTVGTHTMWVDEPGSAKNTLNPKWVNTLRADQSRFGQKLEFVDQRQVETTTLEQLIAAHGKPFYIKIDVEGYEVPVLRGLDTVVPYVSFEVNLPEFRQEAFECIELLDRIAPGEMNYAVDCSNGLALPSWLRMQAFRTKLQECNSPSIEVFWRSVAGM